MNKQSNLSESQKHQIIIFKPTSIWSRRYPRACDPTYSFRFPLFLSESWALPLLLESTADPEFIWTFVESSISIWSIVPTTLKDQSNIRIIFDFFLN